MAIRVRRPILAIVYPNAVYGALLTMDGQYIFEPAPIMCKWAPPGTPTKDVIAECVRRGASYRIIKASEAM